MPPADAVAEIAIAVRAALPRTLIALDFDGTLAPIVADPAESRPEPGVIDALTVLAQAGAQIAVITGRDAGTAARLGGFDAVPGVVIEGLYGAENWHGGELVTADAPPAINELRARLPALVTAATSDPGVWIEDKRLSLVVHTRRAGDPDAALDAIREPLGELSASLGLETHDGRNVLEIRMPGYDKGAVLRRLVDHFEPDVVLFAGDDVGDLPAFGVVRALRARGQRAWGVAASSDEVLALDGAADVHVDGPAGVLALLIALAPV
ncbi:MAG: trehalose-phosphatase [Pseudonocardiales bacterium]